MATFEVSIEHATACVPRLGCTCGAEDTAWVARLLELRSIGNISAGELREQKRLEARAAGAQEVIESASDFLLWFKRFMGSSYAEINCRELDRLVSSLAKATRK